ncbi:F0F1 ATP synthase subunit epsilon [Alkaliphilus hydrothermalis]|uniref:ATP synthase epsilon chain n=1 Tax=Alkaliphilus hydrothermalis TaxID=1482730 RepID=A0ABS2NQD4_9FIRM|nr:F0F1 ATP synthase subunit epsilon [Alkaliphilus hydrothermalis]MBM7615131.1 F-type H+-transporting ATPase subunit epsilon [Alkaliphilus hydrothermalis]
MASKFHLQIITPTRTFLDEEIEMVVLRTVEGDMGIMKNHIPMVTPLSIGKLKINKDGSTREAAIAGGFVHVDREKTVIITDSAEWPDEIDVNRAKEAKERAEERLNKGTQDIDTLRAEIALKKAMNRLNLAQRR